MPLRLAACISVAAALISLPTAAHAARAVRPSSITASTVLPPDRTSTIGLQCPPHSAALNAAVTRRGSAVTVLRSIPGTGAGDWRFKLSAAGSGSRGVRAVIRCVRLQVPAGLSGANVAVRTGTRQGISIPPGGTASARLRCGPAWLATGYGLDAGGSVRLAAAVPVAHGWNFTLENVGSAPVSAGVSARCVRQTVSAGAAELRFRASRLSQSNALPPTRAHRFKHACAPSMFSLATGFAVDPLDTIELAASAPFGKLWGRWTFQQVTGGDRVRTFLVCLSRQSGFS